MPELHRIARCQPWLGTLVEMSCLIESGHSRHLFDAPFAVVARVHALMSLQQPDSELSMLNRAPLDCWVDVAVETGEVLQFALRLAHESALAFNPTFRGGVDATSAYQVRCTESIYQARRVRPCVIDLSGLAKGYAVDGALAVLLHAGAREVMVNAGGDMRHAGHTPQRIVVRRAADPLAHAGVVTLCAQALASSTTRRLNGDGVLDENGVVDARGAALPAEQGVSIVAATAMLADALTKVVLNAPQHADRLLRRYGAQRVVMPDASVA